MTMLERGIPGVPQIINPQQHKVLDYLTIGAFALVGGLLIGHRRRTSRRAGIAAFINAGMVLGATLLTDYDGDGRRPLSFETHGKLDIAQAAMAATAPHLFGFADEGKAWFVRGQALNEAMVIAMTDWAAGARPEQRIRDLAA
jgi:hypothetical protein